MSEASKQGAIISMGNSTHSLISRNEFDAMLMASDKWKFIQEDLFARAYDDLRHMSIENAPGVLLTTVIGVRGQDSGSLTIHYINLVVGEITDAEPSDSE